MTREDWYRLLELEVERSPKAGWYSLAPKEPLPWAPILLWFSVWLRDEEGDESAALALDWALNSNKHPLVCPYNSVSYWWMGDDYVNSLPHEVFAVVKSLALDGNYGKIAGFERPSGAWRGLIEAWPKYLEANGRGDPKIDKTERVL